MASAAIGKRKVQWAFLLPALIYLMLMAILPLIWTLTLSLMKWHANIMPKPQWVGLETLNTFYFKIGGSGTPSGSRRCTWG